MIPEGPPVTIVFVIRRIQQHHIRLAADGDFDNVVWADANFVVQEVHVFIRSKSHPDLEAFQRHVIYSIFHCYNYNRILPENEYC
jgi:hypothetical protein